MARNYNEEGSPESAAVLIASDIIYSGRSTGWCGSLEDLESIRNILKPFNIVYYDDLIGGWRHGKSDSKD